MPWWTKAVSEFAGRAAPFPLALTARAYGRKVHGSLEAAEFFCGRERELALLQEFWEGDNSFVLTLSGIGGSGKTAIVRQFLEQKGWLKAGQRGEDAPRVLIWSFYDYPSTSDFLQAATEFFSAAGAAAPASTVDRLLESIGAVGGRALLVLDGLEKMQAPGSAGLIPRGTIEDPALRQFLLSVADGEVANCRVMVTTRFSMTDFSARPAAGYSEVQLDELDRDAAVDLLRRLGVSDPLEPLLRGYGRHALTLDLLGRLVREFFNGEVPSREVLPALTSSIGTPAVEKQAWRLSRVLHAYISYLTEVETGLMRRVSLFRRPVAEGFLVDLIQAGGQSGFGESLRSLSGPEVAFALRRLAGLRLVWTERSLGGATSVTCHPAVRDYFYSTIDDALQLHRTVQASLLSLVEQPGQGSTYTQAQMDLIEELIYHTVMLGQTEQAFEIYRERLGYLRLGWQRGDHARGINVLSMITTGQVGSSELRWSPEQTARVSIDFALYLKNLGALDEAADVLNSVRDEVRVEAGLDVLPRSEVALALQNLSAILLLLGLLPDAESAAREGLHMAVDLNDSRLEHDCRVRLGTALSMQGSFDSAEDEFLAASRIPNDGGRVVRDVVAVRLGPLLRRTGRLQEALSLLSSEKARFEELNYGTIVARLDVVLSDVLADLGRLDEALVLLERVGEWITTGTDIEMVIAGSIAQARVALLKGDPEAAREKCERAIRLSRRHGYLTYLYDALIVAGKSDLSLGDSGSAIQAADEILLGGGDSSALELSGAGDPRIAYQWAVEDAQRLRELIAASQQDPK
jgi:tetratricopeptide (TPR) repeat protein